jgi:aminoglycoside 6'-N-acetyltransferase
MGHIALRPFDPARDLDQLAAWLERPHVSRWWPDRDHQLEQARRRPAGGGHVLIQVEGSSSGYMRWQPVDPEVLAPLGLPDIPVGSVDMDILIGEPALLGRGIGTGAVRMLCAQLLRDPSIPLVGMVTSTANAPAIRAFRAAGLRRFREYDDPRYGRCLVLVASARG